MLTHSRRTLTASGRRAVVARLPLLALRARREVRAGEIDVITLDVERVWPLISCLGKGCCPYTWLIDTGDDFVYFRSWDLLPFVGADFPGQRVVVDRLPLSHRILGASAAGAPVPVLPHIETPEWELFEAPPRGACAVLPRASVRSERLPRS